MSRTIDLLFFKSPQQPPGSKELEGGSLRLAIGVDMTAEHVNGGILVTRPLPANAGHAACWYPGPVLHRVRYATVKGEAPEPLTEPASPAAKKAGGK